VGALGAKNLGKMLCRCGLVSQKGGLKGSGEKGWLGFEVGEFEVGIKLSYLMGVKIIFNNQCLIIPMPVIKTNKI
jgi:hypothetical protein